MGIWSPKEGVMNPKVAETLLQLATMAYFISMVGYALFLFNQKAMVQKFSLIAISAAVAGHLASMVVYTLSLGHFPIQNLQQSLSMAAFALGAMFLFFRVKFDL